MRASTADLATLRQDLCYRYEQQGCRVPPCRWRLLCRAVHWLFVMGATR